MTELDGEEPRLTVLDSVNNAAESGSIKRSFTDGSAEIAVGAAVASGFGVEAGKSLMLGEAAGRWWLLLAALIGAGSVLTGFLLRARQRRTVQIGIVATAADSAAGLAHARQLDAQAESYSRTACAVTVKSSIRLGEDDTTSPALVQALADRTIEAITLAGQLSPNAIQVDLIPTMRLHVAFWYGAMLGHTHGRDDMVYEPRHADGGPTHFPAVLLKAGEPGSEPLTVHGLETIPGADPTITALALDLQARGDAFFSPVRATCLQEGIGNLLCLSNPAARLPEDTLTFTAAVAQICHTWLNTQLPDGARTGRHAIFLSGPVAISVALGARLASADHGRWTAYTYDASNNTHKHFPP